MDYDISDDQLTIEGAIEASAAEAEAEARVMPGEPANYMDTHEPKPDRAALEAYIREVTRESVLELLEPVLTEIRAGMDELRTQDQVLYGMIQGFQLGYQAAVTAQTGPRVEASPRPKPKQATT